MKKYIENYNCNGISIAYTDLENNSKYFIGDANLIVDIISWFAISIFKADKKIHCSLEISWIILYSILVGNENKQSSVLPLNSS